MILATHMIAGGAVASLFPNHPVTAFFVGFGAHYVMDIIPHWDYKVTSNYIKKDIPTSTKRTIDKYLIFDLLRISADLLTGTLIVLLIWWPTSFMQLEVLSLGVLGCLLPDFFQFIHMRFPHQPMILLQKIHDFFHGEYRLGNKYFMGTITQIILVICMIALAKYSVKL